MEDTAPRFRSATLLSPAGTSHYVDSLRALRDLARTHLHFSHGFLLTSSHLDLYDAFHMRGWKRS